MEGWIGIFGIIMLVFLFSGQPDVYDNLHKMAMSYDSEKCL